MKKSNRKEEAPKNLNEEIERNFDDCWDVHYGPDGGESYFSTNTAVDKSEAMIREIAEDYNKWYGKRLEAWMDIPADFPEMEDVKADLFAIYLKERYEGK